MPKFRLKDRDFDCEQYKSRNKEGIIPPCTCRMGGKGLRKNLRMHFLLTNEMGKDNAIRKTRKS